MSDEPNNTPVRAENLRTIKALAAECPDAFSQPALRKMVHEADDNGLASAIVRVGRRVLIDKTRFDAWLDSHRRGEQ